MTESELQYIELYKNNRDLIMHHSCDEMNALRDACMESFSQKGFPSRKVERYKYTDVDGAFSPDYGLNLHRIPVESKTCDTFKCTVPKLNTQMYIAVNDDYRTANGPLIDEDGIYVGSMNAVREHYPEILSRYYGKIAIPGNDSITDLNTALCQDGLLVYVPKGKQLSKPLQVINLLHSQIDLMVNRRILVVLEENASATLLFCDHAIDKVNFLSTQVFEVYAGNNSQLDIYEMEETHTGCKRFSNMTVDAERDSRVNLFNATLYNGMSRNMTDVLLKGENSEVTMNGCVICDKTQHVDNNTQIEHLVGYCKSEENYRYVLDDSSVGAFAGKILVHPNAQKTISHENNSNLCVTKSSRMYSQPMLEIYADDVKCSHGSTVGVLDEQALFYMRQRGIPLDEAKLLLKSAFVCQVIDMIKLEPLRDNIHYLVNKRFRGELSKCTGCSLCK